MKKAEPILVNAREQPDATLVIPQRNHGDLTAACIKSIRETDPTAWPIVVVDDASDATSPLKAEPQSRSRPRGCTSALASGGMGGLPALADVELLRHERQRGVTAAWNTGAGRAATRFVIWLNNDCIAKGPWVDRLLAPLRVGAVDLVGVAWRIERAVDPALLNRCGGDRFPQGWCFATTRRVWQALDGFDEAMAVYWGDTDFFVRARLSGMRLGVVEGLPLVHLGHKTAHDPSCLRDRHAQWHRDRGAFLRKIRGRIASDSMSKKRTTGNTGT